MMPQFDLNTAMMYGALSANIVSEEPIDMVLHESYDGNKTLWDEWQMEKFVPFNPTDKYTIAVVKNKQTGETKRIMKGAPQVRMKNLPSRVQATCGLHCALLQWTSSLQLCTGPPTFSHLQFRAAGAHPKLLLCCRLCSSTHTTLTRSVMRFAARLLSLPSVASALWASLRRRTSPTNVSISSPAGLPYSC